MSRARPLPPDERRRAIVAATRPLLIEHGAGFTTAQVARAASIAEGTIFRVFASKQELLDAVIADGTFKYVCIAAGGIAARPLRLNAAEAALEGRPPTEETRGCVIVSPFADYDAPRCQFHHFAP